MDYLWKNHSFTIGSEGTYHNVHSLIFGNRSTWDFALYGEDEIKLSSQMILTLGTRYDYHKMIYVPHDKQISPRLGLVYHVKKGTSFRCSAGYGFRAPSIAEVFAEYNYSSLLIIPNLGLKNAERAWTYEIGFNQILTSVINQKNPYETNWAQRSLDYLKPQLFFDIAFFLSHYKNMIDVSTPDNNSVQFINIGRARIGGVEIKLNGSLWNGHLTTDIGYTFLNPIDLDSMKTLPYRTKHQIVCNANIQFWRITFGLDYQYHSRMDEIVPILGSAYDQRVPMHLIDGRIIMDLGSIEFSVEGKNLRNYHYTLRQRFLEPIRNFVFTFRGSF
jgi:outer membrane receptor protein involved in Fe transport